MKHGVVGKWRAKSLGLALGGALLAGLVPAPVTAQLAEPGECPEVMPVADVVTGAVATGYTVSRGTTPETFGADILGVLENGVGPGRDLIVIEASGDAITRAGGIWAGMSGSPVYASDGRLMGAVAYGFSFGPSAIGGVTPAGDMMEVAALGTSSARVAAAKLPPRVKLTEAMTARIARVTGVQADAVGDNLTRLKTPLSVSGAGRGLKLIRRYFKHRGVVVIPHGGGSASAAAAPSERPAPGGNFAATLSYGDVTLAGVGTTTMVCEDTAMAFGHPFFWAGKTRLGANAATALTVIDDPTFGPYKLANVSSALMGTVDQDRLAGIRTNLALAPSTIPVTSDVSSLDTGRSRPDGRTDVVPERYLPLVTFYHMFTNIDSTFDTIGSGSSTVRWSITGTRPGGRTWSLERSNKYVSKYDISFGSLFELYGQVAALQSNGFEDVKFTEVHADIEVEAKLHRYKISKVMVARNDGAYHEVRRMRVEPGDVLSVRSHLRASDGAPARTITHEVKLPATGLRRGAVLRVAGGGDSVDVYCLIYGYGCGKGDKADSFDDLVDRLVNAPKNTDLRTILGAGSRGRKVLAEKSTRLPKVVSGGKRILLRTGDGEEG